MNKYTQVWVIIKLIISIIIIKLGIHFMYLCTIIYHIIYSFYTNSN